MLQFITHSINGRDEIEGTIAAIKGGCRWIQLRMKNASDEEIIRTGKEIRKLCDEAGATFILNDRPDLALIINADGVHLGKEDMSPRKAREILGNDRIIGATANTLEDALTAMAAGADYLGIGPFRFTETKKKLSPVLGLEGLARTMKELRAVSSIPVVAIGGIEINDIREIMKTGVTGIAVSGTILKSPSPVETTKNILRHMDKLNIGGREFGSRLFLGTGKFRSNEEMKKAIIASGTEMVTVAMKRIDLHNEEDDMLKHILNPSIQLLPNTSGVRDAEEAILAAQLAREAFQTDFIKLEIHPDPRHLLPDPIETLKATEALASLGFKVLPYIQADPVLCKRLEDAGASAVMPLGAPIGTNQGLLTRDMLRIIIEHSNLPVVVDAGIGAPSHAAEAMEMGADAVLVNTAIAVAGDPEMMAKAFAKAVEAGREAYLAGLGGRSAEAIASSPLTSFL